MEWAMTVRWCHSVTEVPGEGGILGDKKARQVRRGRLRLKSGLHLAFLTDAFHFQTLCADNEGQESATGDLVIEAWPCAWCRLGVCLVISLCTCSRADQCRVPGCRTGWEGILRTQAARSHRGPGTVPWAVQPRDKDSCKVLTTRLLTQLKNSGHLRGQWPPSEPGQLAFCWASCLKAMLFLTISPPTCRMKSCRRSCFWGLVCYGGSVAGGQRVEGL